MQEIQVQSPGQEDPLEKEMATHSSFLSAEFQIQRILGPGGPQSMGLQELATTTWLTFHFINSYSTRRPETVLNLGVHRTRIKF